MKFSGECKITVASQNTHMDTHIYCVKFYYVNNELLQMRRRRMRRITLISFPWLLIQYTESAATEIQ
jgi:hypothetical protein